MFSSKNDFFDKRFELTDKNIREVRIADEKARQCILKCKYQEQLDNAETYCDLLYARFPFAVLINQIHKVMVNDLRMGNKTYSIEPLPSMYIDNDCEI